MTNIHLIGVPERREVNAEQLSKIIKSFPLPKWPKLNGLLHGGLLTGMNGKRSFNMMHHVEICNKNNWKLLKIPALQEGTDDLKEIETRLATYLP